VEWIDRFLKLVKPVKTYQLSKISDEKSDPHQLKESLKNMTYPDIPQIDTEEPVIIVAGGCDIRFEEKIKAEYRDLLNIAFDGFSGTIFCGGTNSGISGLIGDLSIEGNKFAYLPKNTPSWTGEHSAYQIFNTKGRGFSALEPLQNWIDLLVKGIDPANVRLLGINGGDISAFEFRLALTLGATVGIIRESGRAAHAIFEDTDWNQMPNLMMLPNDPQTNKIFVQGIAPPSMLSMEDIDKMAKDAHDEFRKKRKAKFTINEDPALLDWDELPKDLKLKHSNIQQITHIEEKLRTIDCGIRKVKDNDDVDKIAFSFSESEIEYLSEMEHGRWNTERLLSGWRLGEKDKINKISPYLISWPELPDNIKEYDREAVREIPNLLKKYGYTVYRLNNENA